MNINKFTQKSLQAVQDCEKIAMDYGNQEIEQEHLLYALLTQDDGLIPKMIEKMGLDIGVVTQRVEQAIAGRTKVQGGKQYVGQDLNKQSRWVMSMYQLSICSLQCFVIQAVQ